MATTTRKRRLKAQPGTTEASFEGEHYPVNPVDQTVEVPEEAIVPLLAVGGFVTDDETPEPVPEGYVRLKHPDPGASCSFDGVSYTADTDGIIVVPNVALAELLAHGFVLDGDA